MGEKGRTLVHPTPYFIKLCHHLISFYLVVPMNLFFYDLYWYHESVFTLQFGVVVSILLKYYGYILDLKKPNELF